MLAAITTAILASCSAGSVCLDDDQSIGGYKQFNSLSLFGGGYPLSSVMTMNADILAWQGVATPSLFPPETSHPLKLYGRRSWGDPDPDVSIGAEHYRGAGFVLSVNAPNPCGNISLLGVTGNGIIHYGGTSTVACNNDPGAGYLLHRGGYSGTPSFVREPGFYALWQGAFTSHDEAINRRLNEDGSHPSCDGSVPQTYTWAGDGLCYYEPASKHGSFVLWQSEHQKHGFLFQVGEKEFEDERFENSRAAIDVNGGYVMTSGLSKAQFPAQAQNNIHYGHLQDWYGIDGGQGAQPGALYYAVDEDRWYHMGADGGWKKHMTQDDISACSP